MRRARGMAEGLIGVALVLMGWTPGRAADPPLGGARISAVEGEALVQLGDEGSWRAAPMNMPLLQGDRLQTGATGRLEVLLSNGAAIRLGPASAARLVAVPPAEPTGDSTAEMDLESGRAIVATGDGDRSRAAVAVNATGTRIQVYPRSQVRAETVSADATDVTLREGAATVDALGTSIPLRVGEALQVGRGGALLVASPPQDPFDRWSDSRDRTLAAAPPPAPGIPAPLAAYAGELNQYGQWTSVPQYGAVWQPSAIPEGWAPFTTGEWIWRGGTWAWLSAEPWGWVPFHYGRWRWEPLLGWYWVPPGPRLVVWDPAPVAWIATPAYVTWIPLAPGEVSFPATTVINIMHITVIKKTFINAAAPVPVVVVPATTFTRRRVVIPVASSVTRLSLATVLASQTASVVTPMALAPAVAERRPADPRSARNGSPFAGPNATPLARAPVAGAMAPAPQAPGRAPAFAAPQAPAREVPRASPSPAQPANAGPAAPPLATPRAVPEPTRPAPIEPASPRPETPRPQARTDRERPQAERHEFRPAPHAVEPARPATPTPVPQAPSSARPSPRQEAPPAAAPPQRQDPPPHVAQPPSPTPPAKPPPHPVQAR